MNNIITKYKIIEKRDAIEFSKLVNESIKAGWQPYYEMKVIRDDYNIFVFFQVMIKVSRVY